LSEEYEYQYPAKRDDDDNNNNNNKKIFPTYHETTPPVAEPKSFSAVYPQTEK